MLEPVLAPDVLVLAAGGTLGEAWMTGVLAGLEDGAELDLRRVEAFVGTSAGSIVAATLASGRSPRRPGGGAADPTPEAPAAAEDGPSLPRLLSAPVRWAWALGAPLAAPALAVGAPAGAAARALVLARVPAGTRRLDGLREAVDRSGVRFDGRLRVVAVDRGNGRRVVFGAPGAPKADVGRAVQASCSIPGVFAPVRIGGREYVDGGAWSLTNLDVAPARRDSQVLLLSVWASTALALRTPFAALRGALRAAEAVETLALRRRGAHVRTIGPDAAAADALGPDLMDDRRRRAALAAGYRQGLGLAAG